MNGIRDIARARLSDNLRHLWCQRRDKEGIRCLLHDIGELLRNIDNAGIVGLEGFALSQPQRRVLQALP